MKPRKMKMARDFTLITRRGYIVEFKKDEPVSVPGLAVEEAIEKGAGFCEEDEGFFPQEELTPEQKEVYGPERDRMLKEVCLKIRERNNPDEFTATGVPRQQVVIEEIGFQVDRKEINKIWNDILVEVTGDGEAA